MTRRLLVCIFVVAAMACGGNGGSSASTPGPGGQTVTFHETEFTIAPTTLTIKPGTYTFSVANDGQFPHDLWISTQGNFDLASAIAHTTVMTAGGQKSSFQVTIKAGVYSIWCAVDSHRARGMEGTITVK
jgi:plastocyanin